MYKFRFSQDTNEKFDPRLSLFWVFCVYLTGATLAAILIQSLLGNDIDAICDDAVNCMSINGLFNIVSFLFFPFLYLFYYEKRDMSTFSSQKADLKAQWFLIIIGLFALLACYPALIKIKELTELVFTSEAYLSAEKTALGGYFDGFYSRFKTSETYQEEVINTMISVTNPLEIGLLFLVVAVIPAISEEFFFRGVLQNITMKIGANPHVAIWLVGILFSTMHFSLTDFIPRVLMGALLGYVYYYSKNFWVPVAIHFLNNALTIINLRAVKAGDLALDIEKESQFTLVHLILSLAFCLLIMWQFKSRSQKTLNSVVREPDDGNGV